MPIQPAISVLLRPQPAHRPVARSMLQTLMQGERIGLILDVER